MDNTLVKDTQRELDSQSFKLASTKKFIDKVDSDMYVDDMTLPEFNYFTRLVDDNNYTVAQYKYIVDKAITLATI